MQRKLTRFKDVGPADFSTASCWSAKVFQGLLEGGCWKVFFTRTADFSTAGQKARTASSCVCVYV